MSIQGKYENQVFLTNDWIFHSWSDWDTTNNRTNNYYTYRGNSITEYNVESNLQVNYKRWDPELNPTVGILYVTKYQGNRWYNFFITKTESSTTGYPGSITNFDIINQYTEPYTVEYNGGYEYNYDCQDNQPSSNTGYPWIAYQTRTVYRYKYRTITWNEEAYSITETVPMNYSFTDSSNNNLGIIKWSLVKEISNYEDPSDAVNINFDQYFIAGYSLIELLEIAVEDDVEDELINAQYSNFADIVTYAGTVGVGVVSPSLGIAISTALFICNYIDSSLLLKMAIDEVNSIQDFIDELSFSGQVGVVSFAQIEVNTGNTYNKSTIYEIDSTNINNVSMNFDINGIDSNLLLFEGQNYGRISYNISMDEFIGTLIGAIRESNPMALP